MTADRDHQALALLRRRDPRGIELTYQSYATSLRGFLARMTGDADLADDLLQQVFLRLAERGPDLRPDSNLRAWLFRVARNACYDHLQLRKDNRFVQDGLDVLQCPEPDAEARLLMRDVESALASLRAPDRELLLLVGVEGFNMETISEILDVEPVSLRQRLSRARSRLLHALQELTDQEAPTAQRSEV
jgi:RNA polymerase sigma-70 factor, ECF subfamily